jgi:hypothetical protein
MDLHTVIRVGRPARFDELRILKDFEEGVVVILKLLRPQRELQKARTAGAIFIEFLGRLTDLTDLNNLNKLRVRKSMEELLTARRI